MSRKEAILKMREVLIKRRYALQKALAGDLSLLKELRAQQNSSNIVDAALNSVQDEISSQLAEVESREMARIEYALERIQEGQYGTCEGCGDNIPLSRLNAMPCATLCFACQQEAERQGAGDSNVKVNWKRLPDLSSGDTEPSLKDVDNIRPED